MATAIFNEDLTTVQNVIIEMEIRANMAYPDLQINKTAQRFTVVTGKTQEVMLTIGAMANNGFDNLELFTIY